MSLGLQKNVTNFAPPLPQELKNHYTVIVPGSDDEAYSQVHLHILRLPLNR